MHAQCVATAALCHHRLGLDGLCGYSNTDINLIKGTTIAIPKVLRKQTGIGMNE